MILSMCLHVCTLALFGVQRISASSRSLCVFNMRNMRKKNQSSDMVNCYG